jgi:hypothetical protein
MDYNQHQYPNTQLNKSTSTADKAPVTGLNEVSHNTLSSVWSRTCNWAYLECLLSASSIQSVFKNGYYIPVIHALLYIITDDLFLSSMIAMKLYPANYFYWFSNRYSYLPKHNWVKQFIRFTDTGHLISLLYYLNPDFLPMAFNIHFVITLGYWGGRILFQIEDCDQIENIELNPDFERCWVRLGHILPVILLANRLVHRPVCMSYSMNELWWTYSWMWVWLTCVYLPWRLYTKDIVYSVLEHIYEWKNLVGFICIMKMTALLGHMTGLAIHSISCRVS